MNFDIRTILMNYVCVNECKIFPRYWYCVLIYIWCEALKIWAVCRSHCSISGIYWHFYNSGKIFSLQENIIRIVAGAQPRTLYRSLWTIDSTCCLPIYTFVNEFNYQQSGKFSNKFIYTQFNTRNKHHLSRPNANLSCLQRKYILCWYQNFHQFTT